MKKTKILVIMTLILSLIVGTISSNSVSVEAASTIPDVKIAFLNVCDKSIGNTTGKADATLIQANNQLVLVDCGLAETYDHLKERIRARYAQMISENDVTQVTKVTLEAIVITHNHSDHMGALANILNDSFFEVKKVVYADICDSCGENSAGCTCVCKTCKKKIKNCTCVCKKCGQKMDACTCDGLEKTNLQTIKNAVKGKVQTVVNLQSLPKKSKYTDSDLKPHCISLGYTDIKVYRPINKANYVRINAAENNTKHEKYDTLWTNNRSMIVRVVTNKDALTDTNKGMTALLLGDLYVNGIIAARNVYGSKIFSKDYDVCKVGHHGYRSSSLWRYKINSTKVNLKKLNKDWKSNTNKITFLNKYAKKTLVDAEIAFYNKYIGARNYVFNVSDEKVATQTAGVIGRYNKLAAQKKLKYKNEKGKSVASTCTKYGSLFHVNTSGKFTSKVTKCVKVKKK